MAVFTEPTQWDHPLGNNADVSTLPDDTSATSGAASLQKLFQIINQTPLEAGGVAPEREDINALYKILGDSVFYGMNGGLASYNPAYDYAVGRFVVYNNTLYKCIQANGASSTVVAPDSVSPLGSDYWKDIENQDSTSLIPNQTIVSELPLTDANLHLKDGALLSGSGAYSDYVDLIAEIYNSGDATTSFCTEAEWQTSNTNYGFCNKFVYDSVANTVRLPKVNSEHGALIKSYSSGDSWYRIYQDGWCEQSNKIDISSAETTIQLLVPYVDTNYTVLNSDGWLSGTPASTNSCVRVLSNSSFTAYFNSGYERWFACGYTDISDLQTAPIYEYIVVGIVSKTQIQIDIDNVLADLANKADKDFSNVSAPVQAFKNMSIGWIMPDYSSAITSSTTPLSSTPFVAPSDGIYVMSGNWNSGTNKIYINGVDYSIYIGEVVSGEVFSNLTLLLNKNDSVYFSETATNSRYTHVFFPCKGAN